MTIKVKGETYEDAAELVDTVGKLTAQVFDMPEGKERSDLIAHVEELETALRGYANGEGGETDSPGARRRSLRQPGEPVTTEEDERLQAELLAEGATFVCPMCNGEGELPNEPPEDPRSERCPDCDGWGQVYTGSRVEGHYTRECRTCNGGGFRELAQPLTELPLPDKTAADVPEALGSLWNPERGKWDPPPGQQPPWVGAMWNDYHGRWENANVA